MEPITDHKTVQRLCKITFYCVTLLAAIYAISVALLLKPSRCAEAQCALVPHFAFTNIYTVGANNNTTNYGYPSGCTDKNCICGMVKFSIEDSQAKSACWTDPWGPGGSWQFGVQAGFSHYTECQFRCLFW